MRAVVDTSILVRAVIKPKGTVGPVLSLLELGHYLLVYSRPILDEFLEVLSRRRLVVKYGIDDRTVRAVVRLILLRGELVHPARAVTACRDPKDAKFLEAAVAGQANVLVTGDQDLLVLGPFEGIPIVEPRQFLASLEPR